MSEAMSALNGRSQSGFVTVRDAGLRGMITLRGDLSDKGLQRAATAASNTDMPGRGEMRLSADGRGLGWMSPDELLLLVPHGDAAETAAVLDRKLAGSHHLVADLSDARAFLALEGAGWREVLAKLTPADVSPRAFGPGQIRRTRLAQVAAAFWMTGADRVEVVCFRSVADYVFGLLEVSARSGGEVGYFGGAD